MNFSEKLKLIRKTNNLTQEKFAYSIGISRGNLSGLELGKVSPTKVLINCISMMYNIDKNWLIDDSNDDLSCLNKSSDILYQIMCKYEQLNDPYKKFVETQINQFIELQNHTK